MVIETTASGCEALELRAVELTHASQKLQWTRCIIWTVVFDTQVYDVVVATFSWLALVSNWNLVGGGPAVRYFHRPGCDWVRVVCVGYRSCNVVASRIDLVAGLSLTVAWPRLEDPCLPRRPDRDGLTADIDGEARIRCGLGQTSGETESSESGRPTAIQARSRSTKCRQLRCRDVVVRTQVLPGSQATRTL